MGYATIIAFTTWAPAHVARYAGLTRQTSLVIASVLLAVDIPAAPAWGRLSDRLGRRKPFLVLAFVIYAAGAAALPLVAHAPGPRTLWLVLTVTIMGSGCAMFLPATLAVSRRGCGACWRPASPTAAWKKRRSRWSWSPPISQRAWNAACPPAL